jgi:hypothetical protein
MLRHVVGSAGIANVSTSWFIWRFFVPYPKTVCGSQFSALRLLFKDSDALLGINFHPMSNKNLLKYRTVIINLALT